jgi:putative ABC transport system permease protein
MTTYSNYSSNNNEKILTNPDFAGKFDESKCYELTILPSTYYVNEGTSFSNTSYILPQQVYDDGTFKLSFPENTVAIAKSSAEKVNVKVGESISFKIMNQTFTRTVGLIYDDFSMKSIFIHAEDNIDGTAIADLHAKYITSGYLNLLGDPTQEEIDKIVDEIKKMDIGVATCISLQQTKNKINDLVSSVKLMTMAIKVFAILLAVVCLINLALLNFKERTREIATMKVLGFSLQEIARSLIYEVLILTVVGSLLGLCIGYPLLYLILSINQNNYVSFLYYIEPASYILGVVLAVVTSLVVNIILSFFINKVPMVESLKSVE